MPVERPSFTAERLGRLIQMERTHFWFAARRRFVAGLLRRFGGSGAISVLDVGTGGGLFCQQLAESGYRMIAVDFLPGGLQRLRQEAPGVRLLQSSGESIALRGEIGRAHV